MTAEGLQNNHNHNNLYFTKSEIVPVIDSRINDSGSYSPYASTLMLRDGSGRSQVNTPRVNADAANKGYTDTLVAGETSARIAGDMNLQAQVTEISGTYATDVEAASLQAQIDFLKTMIMDISGTGFYSGGAVPVGTVISQAGSASLGMEWGDCDGGALSASANPELFARIGYTFGGSGDTFLKPDIRGDFPRGWDAGRGIDPGRIFGSEQTDDNKAHIHTTNVTSDGAHNHTASADASGDHFHTFPLTLVSDSNTIGVDGPSTADDGTHVNQTNNAGTHSHVITIDNNGNHSHGVTINSTGTESRPRNIALKFFIKLYTPPMIEPVDVSTTQEVSGQKTFLSPIIFPELPQAIIFGDPLVAGTKALGVIGGQVVITMHVSGGTWTPLAWLT
jgi:microcystin-dependent protein